MPDGYAADAPCRSCPEQAKCASEQIACKDFVYYVTHGETPDLSEEDAEPRHPNRSTYNSVFELDEPLTTIH